MNLYVGKMPNAKYKTHIPSWPLIWEPSSDRYLQFPSFLVDDHSLLHSAQPLHGFEEFHPLLKGKQWTLILQSK